MPAQSMRSVSAVQGSMEACTCRRAGHGDKLIQEECALVAFRPLTFPGWDCLAPWRVFAKSGKCLIQIELALQVLTKTQRVVHGRMDISARDGVAHAKQLKSPVRVALQALRTARDEGVQIQLPVVGRVTA